MKRFLYYFIWTLAIGFFVYTGLRIQEQLVLISQTNFDFAPLQIYIAIFSVAIGLLLRTPKFILETKGQKGTSFDGTKFAAIGLPALLVHVMTVLPYLPISEGWVPVFSLNVNLILYSNPTVPTIAGIIFGYIFLGSFKKTDFASHKKGV